MIMEYKLAELSLYVCAKEERVHMDTLHPPEICYCLARNVWVVLFDACTDSNVCLCWLCIGHSNCCSF